MPDRSTSSRRELLDGLTFGESVAEQEKAELENYFVETDQWERLLAGTVDIVYGAKGSGKSALYSLLTQDSVVRKQLRAGVVVVPVENPSGTPAFKALLDDPPATEDLFVGMWKLYFLTLLAAVLTESHIRSSSAKAVYAALYEEGLLQPRRNLSTLLARVSAYIKALATPTALETTVAIDPTSGLPTGLGAKITLSEPSPSRARTGAMSVDRLLATADDALCEPGTTVWLVADRLDVAFGTSQLIEARALRALFRTYLDMQGLRSVKVKLFLRSDIWNRITSEGFREGSHIVRHLTLRWDKATLLQLMIRRLLSNAAFREKYLRGATDEIPSARRAEEILNDILPAHLVCSVVVLLPLMGARGRRRG